MTNNNEIINIQNVLKVYKGDTDVYALNDVSLIIEENEFFTLLGPSGCGKTTLLRLIAGFEHPTNGTILLNGDDISLLPPNKRPVNTVFQSYALFPHMTVAGNIAFGLEMLGWSKQEVSKTVDEMLELVKMEDLKNRRPSEISGGQQQRVALARALAPKPKVLLLDEPLSALDLKLRKQMQIELKRLQSETGITFVFVTHDQEEALTMSDRIAVMSEGQVLQYGNPREIYHHPENKFVANFIGDANVVKAEIINKQSNTYELKLAEINVKIECDNELNSSVSVALRPEKIEIKRSNDNNCIHATINNASFVGSSYQYILNSKLGKLYVISNDTNDVFEVGEEVFLNLNEKDIRVLND